MDASSSSSSRLWSYDVFPSFRGEDVRNTFLSHCYREFQRKGIKTFEDQKMRRGQTINPELIQAIRESRISMVVLSKNYASSGWCLDELLEIMSCRDAAGQTVMAIFYGVDPRDVRDQTGDFGTAFMETCNRKADVEEEKKQRWTKALTAVGHITGYHYVRERDEEAKLIESIVADVLKELNYSIVSRDFNDLVGIGIHIDKISSLLCLESNEARMVSIWGPAGIGKTTLARVLCNWLSPLGNFQLICFMDNIGKAFKKPCFNSYRYKLDLQEWFLSKILDIKDLKIHHLGAIKERLSHLKVLIVLDDVEKKEQLEALADQMEWFGAGSRIIVTTEDKSILDAYRNSHVYEMGFPSNDEAMKIFCKSAFGQSSPPDGFCELAKEVVSFVGNLPLGLKVLGSSLQGMKEHEWKDALPRLRTSLNGGIKDVLRYGYDCLEEKDQAIFRHVACMFNGRHVDSVISLLDDSDMNVKHGLKVLAKKCLICLEGSKRFRRIIMNKLLAQVGREIVRKQSLNPRKREFLVDGKDIEDVLTQNTDKKATCLGISLPIGYGVLSINERAFERMTNIQFLRIEGYDVQLPQGLVNLPPKLKLLEWSYYPANSFPPDFCPKHLVELSMRGSNLEKLWEGTKPLGRLKRMDLTWAKNLKEIPDLSKAANLETLDLSLEKPRSDLVALPYIGHLSKLKTLDLYNWASLEVLPTNINLKSLNILVCAGCTKLRWFPEISQNLETLNLHNGTAIAEVPSSVANWSRLIDLNMSSCKNLKTFPHVPNCIERLTLSGTGIEEVPSRIKNLFRLRILNMAACKKLRNISYNVFKLENLEELEFFGCENLESFSPLEALEIPRENVSTTLHLVSTEFQSNRDLEVGKRQTLNLSGCRKLVELPKLPIWVSKVIADNCESLERISHPFNNNLEMQLHFGNCFKLNEEAGEIIQETVCSYSLLPGTKLPSYITHRTSGSSLTISSEKVPVSGFFESKAYLLLAAMLDLDCKLDDGPSIKCRVNFQHGSVSFQREWLIPIFTTVSYLDHLIIFRIFDWPKEDDVPRDELSHDERVLEFTCVSLGNSEVRELGVYQPSDFAYVSGKEQSNTDTDSFIGEWSCLRQEKTEDSSMGLGVGSKTLKAYQRRINVRRQLEEAWSYKRIKTCNLKENVHEDRMKMGRMIE